MGSQVPDGTVFSIMDEQSRSLKPHDNHLAWDAQHQHKWIAGVHGQVKSSDTHFWLAPGADAGLSHFQDPSVCNVRINNAPGSNTWFVLSDALNPARVLVAYEGGWVAGFQEHGDPLYVTLIRHQPSAPAQPHQHQQPPPQPQPQPQQQQPQQQPQSQQQSRPAPLAALSCEGAFRELAEAKAEIERLKREQGRPRKKGGCVIM